MEERIKHLKANLEINQQINQLQKKNMVRIINYLQKETILDNYIFYTICKFIFYWFYFFLLERINEFDHFSISFTVIQKTVIHVDSRIDF